MSRVVTAMMRIEVRVRARAAVTRVRVVRCPGGGDCWPTAFAFTPNNRRIFYLERFTGRIRVFNLKTRRHRTYHRIRNVAGGGERDWLPGATEALLNHRHWEVRRTFCRVLASLEGAASRHRLEERLLLEGEELVRQAIQELLAEFRESGG